MKIEYHLDDNLGFLLNATARLMRNELELRLSNLGLTPTTWAVLMALGDEDRLRQSEISRRALLDGATTTRALDILEGKGLIERTRDELDRRAQIVTLTSAGKKIYPQLARLGGEVNEYATQLLSDTERTSLQDAARRIIQVMHRVEDNAVEEV